jgi:hypothetical protein
MPSHGRDARSAYHSYRQRRGTGYLVGEAWCFALSAWTFSRWGWHRYQGHDQYYRLAIYQQ